MIKVKKNVMVEKEFELPVEYGESFRIRETYCDDIYPGNYKINNTNSVIIDEQRNNFWKFSSISLGDLVGDDAKYTIIKYDQKPFWAEDGDEFYSILLTGRLTGDIFNNGNATHLMKRKVGNCFKTSNLTEKQVGDYLNFIYHKDIVK